jgi:uncharacterized protein YraI
MKTPFICMAAALIFAASAIAADAAIVCRLNPYGDNYLSLRAGPGSDFAEITRLGPDTGLSVFGGEGPWLRVRTEDGSVGWVFSRYVCGR